MENAQTENSAAGGASVLTDVLERMRTRADNARVKADAEGSPATEGSEP